MTFMDESHPESYIFIGSPILDKAIKTVKESKAKNRGIMVSEVFSIGDQIAYIPNHADGDIRHPDVELGFITSIIAASKTTYFCRFWNKGEPGILRTTANSEPCDSETIVKHPSVSQKIVNEFMKSNYSFNLD